MLLFSSALVKHKLTYKRLNDCMDYLPLAAKWAEDEWGYVRNKGLEYREGVLNTLRNDLYIGTFGGQPIAMFALLKHDIPHSRQLMYVYVDKAFRGLGFGKQIIEEAKHLTAEVGANLILLDTLKPSLNKLYEKNGAKVLGEGTLFSHPTDVLSMTI